MTKLILPLALMALFVLGGLGYVSNYILIAGIFLPFVFHFLFNPKKKILLPPNFLIYVLFLGISLLGLAWSQDIKSSVYFILLFLSGASFWIYAYNDQEMLLPYLKKIIVILGLTFGILFLYYSLTGLWPPGWGVFSFTSQYRNHNHIGDFWSIVMLIPIFAILTGSRKLIDFGLLAVGIFLVSASLSRSAYLSLFFGSAFIFWKLNLFERYRNIFLVSVLTLITIFLITSFFKPTFETRIYFIQSILGLKMFPLGVGLGNFSFVSSSLGLPLWALSSYSAYVHNIALEMMAGLGILGLVFIYWLIRVTKIVLGSSKYDILYGAIFICLLVNFLFDRTYLTPTMIWLWFMSLGLVQSKRVHK